MDLHAKFILAVVAIVVLTACILADELRVWLNRKKKYHRLTISIGTLYTSTVIFRKRYRYQWLAILGAWRHTRKLPNLKPLWVQTKIEETYE